jgi:hypothetical protein
MGVGVVLLRIGLSLWHHHEAEKLQRELRQEIRREMRVIERGVRSFERSIHLEVHGLRELQRDLGGARS